MELCKNRWNVLKLANQIDGSILNLCLKQTTCLYLERSGESPSMSYGCLLDSNSNVHAKLQKLKPSQHTIGI